MPDGNSQGLSARALAVQHSEGEPPGFYFAYYASPAAGETVVEYARNAQGHDAPLRQLEMGPSFGFIGADRNGDVYEFRNESLATPCSKCLVLVRNATGEKLYTVLLAQNGFSTNNRIATLAPFVDENGSIYYITYDCKHLIQLPPGARGPNPKPLRILDMPEKACKGGSQHSPPFSIFATTAGAIYFTAPYGFAGSGEYIWSKHADGSTPPERVITDGYADDVVGVDKNGSSYSLGLAGTRLGAWRFGPSANGNAQPAAFVPLKGAYATILRMDASDRFVYEGLTARYPTPSSAEILIAPPGGNPVRRLYLPSYFKGDELVSITF